MVCGFIHGALLDVELPKHDRTITSYNQNKVKLQK